MVVYGEAVYQAVHGVCTQPEFDALCSLTWNIGIAGMKKSSVVRLHNAGDKAAAARAFGLWNKSRGKVLPGLVRRRSAEAALYLAGSTEMPQAVDVEKPMVKSTTIIAGSTAGACEAYLQYRFVAGYDCSTPGNRRCMGVWTRQQERYSACMQAQQ